MSNNSNNFQTILLVLITIMMLYNIFTFHDVRTNIKEYKNKIEKIQIKIDSSESVNLILNSRLSQINDNISLLTDQINLVNEDITQIKKNTNEKVNSIDTAGFNDIERFFSERYK